LLKTWYFELKGKSRAGGLKREKTFVDAAKQVFFWSTRQSPGERDARYVKDHEATLGNPLIPYFSDKVLSPVANTGGAAPGSNGGLS